MPPSPPPAVSIVIPCLNEEAGLAACLRDASWGLEQTGVIGEIIVADNGSTDRSRELALALGARVVTEPARGYGTALRAGIAAARGPVILIGDADFSYDFREIPRFVAKHREGFDIVMGNRFTGRIEPGAMPWLHRHLGNPLLTGLLNVLFHSGVGDVHCGIRSFSKAAYQRMNLVATGMEFTSEFVIRAAQLDARMTEIPVVLRRDLRSGAGHLRSFRDGWRNLRMIVGCAIQQTTAANPIPDLE